MTAPSATHQEALPILPEGWAREAPNPGSLVYRVSERDARIRGVAYLVAGLGTLLVLLAFWDLPAELAASLRGQAGPGGALALGVLAAVALTWAGLRSLTGREEWRVGDNFVEIRRGPLAPPRRYVGARLLLESTDRTWNLLVERGGRKHCLAYALKPLPSLALADELSRHTGWPLSAQFSTNTGYRLTVDRETRTFRMDPLRLGGREQHSGTLEMLGHLRIERLPPEVRSGSELRLGVLLRPTSPDLPPGWLHVAPRGEGVEGWKAAYHAMAAWAAFLHLPLRDDCGVDHWKEFRDCQVVPSKPPQTQRGPMAQDPSGSTTSASLSS